MSLSWSKIHRIAVAESIRAHRELGVDTSRPIDPFLALQRSGVLVMRQPLDRLSGAYLPADSKVGNGPGVLINVAHPPSRQRYTAAHELWHHRRDRDLILDADTEWLPRGGESNLDRERLAEAFASWFLMPKRLVESTIDMLGMTPRELDEQNIYGLALELGTSYTATVRQLHGLKLITPAVRDRLLNITPQTIKRTLGDSDATSDPWKDIRLVSPQRRQRAVVAMEGDVVVLEMPEIPSSGYLWQPVELPEMVSLVRDEYSPLIPASLGGNGIHRFVFSLLRGGQYRIRLELGRPWQQGQTVEAYDIELVAEAKPAAGMFDPSDLIRAAA